MFYYVTCSYIITAMLMTLRFDLIYNLLMKNDFLKLNEDRMANRVTQPGNQV